MVTLRPQRPTWKCCWSFRRCRRLRRFGNLYQSMGRPAQALDAYFEAGLRLKAEGNREKLQQIIELMQKEGDGRGDQLRQ